MKTVKIKIKLGNNQIEIEGDEDFIIKYLNSQNIFKSEGDVKTSNNTGKKKKGSIYSDIVEVIRVGGNDGTTINDIVGTTNLTKKQITPILTKAKKNGAITTIEKGVYVIVEKVDKTEEGLK